MSFATQGAISGSVNNNSLFRGSTAGGRGGVLASSFNVQKFNKEIDESIKKDTEKLRGEVQTAKEADLQSLEKQYENILDSYTSESNQKQMFDDSYTKYKEDLDKQYNSKLTELRRNYYPDYRYRNCIGDCGFSDDYNTKLLTNNYNKALKTLSNDLTSKINDIVGVAEKAKQLTDSKADSSIITIDEIRDFQNQYIDDKSNIENDYKNIYSEQLSSLQDRYADYRQNMMNQIFGKTMNGKRISSPRKIKVKRLYPRLRAVLRRPHIRVRIPNITCNSKKLSLDKQLSRNFRKMI